MMLSTFALDFDGTIARNDVLDPGVRQAIADVRAQGIVVLLVTGRILDDLRRVAGDLHFVDAVVAENGAVVEFPDSGYGKSSAEPPPPAFLDELRREGIPFAVGQSVVDAAASAAPRILAILQRMELPLVLAFNRGRVMVLPQAVSKATGLLEALTILRLSPHNAIAIGDAENDHQLLRACEVGVAVAWGSQALMASADYVLPGDGPPAVARYLLQLASLRRVPEPPSTRRRLLLGHSSDGSPLALAVWGRNVLIAGDPKTGKSWVAGLLCEQLILYGYSLCILDPEGDYTSLEALPGVVVFGGADPLPRPRDLLRALRHADISVVIDLSHTRHEEKIEYVRTVLRALATLRRHTGLPHRIVVDEAHYFLHGQSVPGLLDLDMNGYTLVTYAASTLPPELLAACEVVIATRESDPGEARALFDLCHSCEGQVTGSELERTLDGLVIGEAVALPVTKEAEGRARRIRLAPRLTPHVRHMAKYIDIPVPEGRAFQFSRNGSPAGPRASTLREFVAVLEKSPEIPIDGHLRHGDFSRWIANVFGDYPLAGTVRKLEQDYSAGAGPPIAAGLVHAIRARYEFVDPVLNTAG